MRRTYTCYYDSDDYLSINNTLEGAEIRINYGEDITVVFLSPNQLRDLADQLRTIADKAEPNRKPDITGDSFL